MVTTAHTPGHVVAQLNHYVNEAPNDLEMAQILGLDVAGSTPKELATLMNDTAAL